MSREEYIKYCFACECEGEIPQTFEQVNYEV